MGLTVLSIAYPFAPVGPCGRGGAERILTELDAQLVAAGHRSLVVACAGSIVAGELFAAPMPERALLTESDRSWHRWRQQAAIDRALSQHSVDVVHMHGVDIDQTMLPPDVPVVMTLHQPPSWYRPEMAEEMAGRAQFVCVSESQRKTYEPLLGNVTVIENGVPLPPVRMDREREDFALTLGRLCPESNMHEALEAGTLAGTRVLIGGHVLPDRDHGNYFQEKVEPLLSGEGSSHRFLGELETERRQRLLARAKCLVHASRAQATSSLVAMEALAAGTPVIAYRAGVLPEIVDDGVTGFLVDDVQEMAKAFGRVGEIRREDCRAAAETRFSSERMAAEYMALYAQLVGRPRAVKYA